MQIFKKFAFFFQYCQPAQVQPISYILFHKNGSLRDFYIMTLTTESTKKRPLCKSLHNREAQLGLEKGAHGFGNVDFCNSNLACDLKLTEVYVR